MNIVLDSPLNTLFKYSFKIFFRQTVIERGPPTCFSVSFSVNLGDPKVAMGPVREHTGIVELGELDVLYKLSYAAFPAFLNPLK